MSDLPPKPKRSKSKSDSAIDAAIQAQINQQVAMIIGEPELEGVISEDVMAETDLVDARNELSRLAESYTKLDDSADPAPTKTSLAEYIERGKIARASMDGGKWQLCYLAAQVVIDWGESSLNEWAGGVGIASSTAYYYKRLETFFPLQERLKFCDEHTNADGDCAVFFSHFGQALILPTPAIAYEWLEIVANAPHWSVDIARIELEKWIKLRGYAKRKQPRNPNKTKVELCKNLTINNPELSELHGEWFLTMRVTDEDAVVKALKPILEGNKTAFLQLTLTKAV